MVFWECYGIGCESKGMRVNPKFNNPVFSGIGKCGFGIEKISIY